MFNRNLVLGLIIFLLLVALLFSTILTGRGVKYYQQHAPAQTDNSYTLDDIQNEEKEDISEDIMLNKEFTQIATTTDTPTSLQIAQEKAEIPVAKSSSEKPKLAIQIGLFSNFDNAEKFQQVASSLEELKKYKITIHSLNSKHQVLVLGFEDVPEAAAIKKTVDGYLKINSILIQEP